jgi:hypothetical protein
MYHAHAFEIGPALNLDVSSAGEALLTVNLALGFAVL